MVGGGENGGRKYSYSYRDYQNGYDKTTPRKTQKSPGRGKGLGGDRGIKHRRKVRGENEDDRNPGLRTSSDADAQRQSMKSTDNSNGCPRDQQSGGKGSTSAIGMKKEPCGGDRFKVGPTAADGTKKANLGKIYQPLNVSSGEIKTHPYMDEIYRGGPKDRSLGQGKVRPENVEQKRKSNHGGWEHGIP